MSHDPARSHPPTQDDPLFRPVSLGGLALANRVALAPMTRVSAAPDGTPTDQMAQYYASFARGGFGLVVTEGTYTDDRHSQGYLNQPGMVTDDHEAGWAGVVEAVHAAGGKAVLQLMHAGSQSQGNRFESTTIGPSAVRPRGDQLTFYRGDGPYPTPRPVDPAELVEIRAGFAAAARRAVRAGFDGVEIHGANGYLLDQFLTDYLNLRDDEYGGTTAHRVRLAAETCTDVLDAVGHEIAVGIRISQAKVSDPDYRWPGGESDAEVIFTALGTTGIDFVHTADYRADAPAFADDGPSLAALAKTWTGLPVIANGQLDEPARARTLLAGGAADVVALGKAALAHHDWPRRARDGDAMDHDLPADLLQPLADLKEREYAG